MSGAGEDRFARFDAAYLLGALEPEDRAAYVEHLRTCASCRDSVTGLAGLPGLLARVPPDLLPGAGEPDEPPATLLPALLAEVARTSRRRRRRAVAGAALGAVAAAVVAVVALGALGVTGRSNPVAAPGPSTAAPAATVTLAPVAATPIRATAQLQPVAWGTRIVLRCTYTASTAGRYGTAARSYALVVQDRSGQVQQVATWNAVPGQESVVSAATAWSPADIAGLQIRTAAGSPVLTTTLSG